ncbi:MAG TPA: MBL fold metallo-hydrolase [Chitinophagaceae bacterium]|nr:MBL fold metallo-hydrolase [Chitinophagaceae bacterium]
MKIIPLSEGSFTVDKTKQFIPFDHEKDKLQERNAGSLLVEIQPFVIVTSKDILLLDTGLGFINDDVLQVHRNLRNNGIEPSDVTKVLLSHLHKDHSGGISQEKNGKRILSFAHATYYINKDEFEFAFENATSSYITEDFEILKNSPQLKLIEGNGKIDNYINYEVTGAHSPYHQVFWIQEGEKAFFGGDVAPQLQQMKNKFVAKYDYDGKKSMALRQQWREQGEQEKWVFLFYHDIKTPVFKFQIL